MPEATAPASTAAPRTALLTLMVLLCLSPALLGQEKSENAVEAQPTAELDCPIDEDAVRGEQTLPTAAGASGLRVYVDPVTGELTSTPPPRALRVLESQSKPPTGDLQREVVEIPGVGIGIYVGDLFMHSMQVTVEEAPHACPAESPAEKAPATSHPVAVQ